MTVPRAGLSERELEHIENLCAEGYKLEEVAKDFGMSLRQFLLLRDRDARIPERIKAGEDRYDAMTDAERRRRLSLEDEKFRPTPADIQLVRELASIGWAELKIADQFKVGPRSWKAAKDKYPLLAEAVRCGFAEAGGRRIQNTIDSWMPTPDDLKKIKDYAAEGMTAEVISVELGLPTGTLRKKMDVVPDIREAYEAGSALAEYQVVAPLFKNAKKGQINAGIYYLKSRRSRDWSDRPQSAAEINASLLAQKNNGKHKTFSAPKPLPLKDFTKEAAKEAKAAADRRAKIKKAES